jgi:competence protein ComEC
MVKKSLLTFFVAVTLAFSIQTATQIINRGNITVNFIDVGQGDAALITTAGGRNFLIDSGNDDATQIKNASVVRYLNSKNIRKIDVATVSHYDSDHAGGMRYVVYYFDVDLLILPLPLSEKAKEMHDEIISNADEDTQIVYASVNDNLTIGENMLADIIFYDQNSKDENEQSLVMKVTCFEEKFIFTGDIGFSTEQQILETIPNEDINVAKVAHHGSKYSSSQEFYEALTPEYAVISVGNNSYGHPTTEAMERITATGAKIIRTDKSGTINFLINKIGIKEVVTQL